MHQFDIILSSFQQVQEFVALALQQPFDVLVGNENQQINGKDLLGMFSLDYTRSLQVQAKCDEGAFSAFHRAAQAIASN